MYQVLARKYRSQRFDEVVGQQPIAQTLKNAIKTGRVAHAYLFTGTRGIGKTTMARILAKALNCLESDSPTTEPCCKCDACVSINTGDDIDVIEIDGASNRGIDNIRELIGNAIYRPARCRFKIYIIDEVHMLTTEAFNALLKILEEPPGHVKFIFATTEPNKVIATIQSRCQRFDFNNISAREITAQLEKILKSEKIKYEKDVALPIAKMANGSMRDALSLLDRIISTGAEPLSAKLLEEYVGCPEREKISRLINNIAESNAAGTLESVQELLNTGVSEIQLVDFLTDYFRDIMVVEAAGTEAEFLLLTEEQKKTVSELAEKFDIAAVIYNITTLEKLRWTIKSTDVPRPLLEAALLRFALSEHFINTDQLKSQGGGEIKNQLKKNALNCKAESVTNFSQQQTKTSQFKEPAEPGSIESNWPEILTVINRKAGNGTSSLLQRAVVTNFEGDVLTITFDASAKIQKKMCESNGRCKQIEEAVSEYLGRKIELKIELGKEELTATGRNAVNPNSIKQKENEIVNDPAVRTVLTELGATVTGIEQF